MGYGIIRCESRRMTCIAQGVVKMAKLGDHSLKLKKIFDEVIGLIDSYHPDELSIEAPFFGKNVQSMLKLGRAQGVAIAAALSREIPYSEYAPRKIKQAITGNGNASKEQVAQMVQTLLNLKAAQNISMLPMDWLQRYAIAFKELVEMKRAMTRGRAFSQKTQGAKLVRP